MKWKKSPLGLIARFEAVVPGAPAETRPMFGYPAAFVNGNMFMGLFQDWMILRLDEAGREAFAGLGARPFEPMPGRPMREYATVPESVLANTPELKRWVARAYEYGSSLAPKSKKAPRAAGKKAATKSVARRKRTPAELKARRQATAKARKKRAARRLPR